MQIEITNLSKSYPTPTNPLEILRDLTLLIPSAQSTAILGPSGSGKSTLLNILGTLDTPTSGSVAFLPRDRSSPLSPLTFAPAALAQFRAAYIGFVFQDHHLLPQLNALENILLPKLALGGGAASSKESSDRAAWLLARIGLESRRSHLPTQLSGGERQRIAIARALMNAPFLLLADEPTGNLDPHTADSIISLLLSIATETAATLIAVTHNPALAERFQKSYTMHNGQLA